MVTKYLVLNFKNESGDKVMIFLRGIKDNLTGEEISKTTEVIISKNDVFSSNGKLIQTYGAQIITKNVDNHKMGRVKKQSGVNCIASELYSRMKFVIS